MRLRGILLFIASGLINCTAMAAALLPDFLPDYFSPAFYVNGVDLKHDSHSLSDGVHRWSYAVPDDSAGLVLEWIPSEGRRNKAVFNNVLNYLANLGSGGKGYFNDLGEYSSYIFINDNSYMRHYYIYRLPGGVRIWTYSFSLAAEMPKDHYDLISQLENRNRFDKALKIGNVEMGRWSDEFYSYAQSLLKRGKKDEAVLILQEIIATSPHHYEAHLAYAKNTHDKAAAANSALTIAANAEDEGLISEAESILSNSHRRAEDLPLLNKGEVGLQLILVPLPPCRIQILNEAAEIYQKMMGIPVKRAPYQRTVGMG